MLATLSIERVEGDNGPPSISVNLAVNRCQPLSIERVAGDNVPPADAAPLEPRGAGSAEDVAAGD